jgi:hypothetical protein
MILAQGCQRHSILRVRFYSDSDQNERMEAIRSFIGPEPQLRAKMMKHSPRSIN